MNRNLRFLILLAVILIGFLFIATVLLLTNPFGEIVVFTPTPTATVIPTPTPSSTLTPTPSPIQSASPIPTSQISDLIVVTNPSPNQIIRSPLTITGQARGPWFFEASAPVRLFDANGINLAAGFITAQGNWMTTDFVPFAGQISFSTPATNTGELVLENDNPSGLAENSRQIVIPVRFR